MNYIFISPGFPLNYWNFANRLAGDGVTVLGIGDIAYDLLDPRLKESLTEYYKVSSLENYDEVYRAVAFFAFKYGKIDWLESNNEYWLELDARLRTDFHITSGLGIEEIQKIKCKSKMKAYYEKAGVKTARYHLVDDFNSCLSFIKEVGYPVVVKPDNGVGASETFRLKSDEELTHFFETKRSGVTYIMEEYVDGTIITFDGVQDSLGLPVYCASFSETDSLMDVVNENKDTWYYVKKEVEPDLLEAGVKTLLSFGTKSRYFHLEFFRANSDKEGRWKKGEILGLEVNMRPAGGYTPDMENFAGGVDLYQIYADSIVGKKDPSLLSKPRKYCAYAAKRKEYEYEHTEEEIQEKYQSVMKMEGEIPLGLQSDLGDHFYIAVFDTYEEVQQFAYFILRKKEKTLPTFEQSIENVKTGL